MPREQCDQPPFETKPFLGIIDPDAAEAEPLPKLPAHRRLDVGEGDAPVAEPHRDARIGRDDPTANRAPSGPSSRRLAAESAPVIGFIRLPMFGLRTRPPCQTEMQMNRWRKRPKWRTRITQDVEVIEIGPKGRFGKNARLRPFWRSWWAQPLAGSVFAGRSHRCPFREAVAGCA